MIAYRFWLSGCIHTEDKLPRPGLPPIFSSLCFVLVLPTFMPLPSVSIGLWPNTRKVDHCILATGHASQPFISGIVRGDCQVFTRTGRLREWKRLERLLEVA